MQNNLNTIKNVASALLQAKKVMQRPKLNQTNGHFGSKYSDLNEITRVVEDALSQFDLLMFRHVIQAEGNKVGIQIEILHTESGESILCNPVYRSYHKAGSHAESSAETYAARAAISHALNLSLEADTDANDIQPPQREKKPSQAKPEPVEAKKKSLDAFKELAQENRENELRVKELRRFMVICKSKSITSVDDIHAIIYRYTNGSAEKRRDLKLNDLLTLNTLLENCSNGELARVIASVRERMAQTA